MEENTLQARNVLSKRAQSILGIQFVISVLLLQLPYSSSMNMLMQMGIMGISAILYVYEPASALSAILLFNVLPTMINSATHSAQSMTGVYYLGYRMAWLFLLVIGILYILQHRNAFLMKRNAGGCVGFGAYILASGLWARDMTYYSDVFILLVGIYLAFPLLINSEEDVLYVWNTFILAGMLLAVSMMIYTLRVGAIQQTGVEKNSNYISLDTLIILALDAAYLLEYWRRISRLYKALITASIISSVFLLISYASRTAFLLLVAFLFLMAGILLKNNRRALIGMIVIAAIAIYLILSMGVFEFLATNFFKENFETGNGRTLLWAQYLQEYFDEGLLLKIFGRGFHVFRARFLGYDIFAHNSYLSILIDFGLIGFGLFVGNAIMCFGSLWKNRQQGLAMAVLIISAFLFAIDGYQDAMCASFIAFMAGSIPYISKKKRLGE